jgi:hypothetical protein
MDPFSTSTYTAAQLTNSELTELEHLLKRKVADIPHPSLVKLSLANILSLAPQNLTIEGIPPDLQLALLLRNRALIDRSAGKPLKNEDKQSPDITRAIFYYRLDEARHFWRYHDSGRWNPALFIALLTTPSNHLRSSPPGKPTPTTAHPPRITSVHDSPVRFIPPAARRFMHSYLAALLENHNTPFIFTARETFVRLWKSGVWDVYTLFGASQKKLLKKEMKRLGKEWEIELDLARSGMGSNGMTREDYNLRVAPFVGSIVPGRKDQGLPVKTVGNVTPAASPEAEGGVVVDSKALACRKAELLEALRVPLQEQEWNDEQETEEVSEVTDMRTAIAALRTNKPAEILRVLLQLFPMDITGKNQGGEHWKSWQVKPQS